MMKSFGLYSAYHKYGYIKRSSTAFPANDFIRTFSAMTIMERYLLYSTFVYFPDFIFSFAKFTPIFDHFLSVLGLVLDSKQFLHVGFFMFSLL